VHSSRRLRKPRRHDRLREVRRLRQPPDLACGPLRWFDTGMRCSLALRSMCCRRSRTVEDVLVLFADRSIRRWNGDTWAIQIPVRAGSTVSALTLWNGQIVVAVVSRQSGAVPAHRVGALERACLGAAGPRSSTKVASRVRDLRRNLVAVWAISASTASCRSPTSPRGRARAGNGSSAGSSIASSLAAVHDATALCGEL
jgi:hypothetical protein